MTIAMIMAQLAEWLLPLPEAHSSKLVGDKNKDNEFDNHHQSSSEE